MTSSTLQVVQWALLACFVLGGVRLLRRWGTRRAPRDTLRLLLLVLFLVPLCAYFVIGLVQPRFGNPRNFVYLLPLYGMVAFHGLEWVAVTRSLRTLLAAVLLIAVAAAGGSELFARWKDRYADRAMLDHAAGLEADMVVVAEGYFSTWPMKHWLLRRGQLSRIVPRSSVDGPDEGRLRPYWPAAQQRVQTASSVVLVERGPASSGAGAPTIRLAGRALTRQEERAQVGFFGPFATIQRWFDTPVRLESYRAGP